MTLKKPTLKKHTNDLQDYVSSLLVDESNSLSSKDASNVTRLSKREKNNSPADRKTSTKINSDIGSHDIPAKMVIPLKNDAVTQENQNQKHKANLIASEKKSGKAGEARLNPAGKISEEQVPQTTLEPLAVTSVASDPRYLKDDDPRLKKVEQLLSRISLASLTENKLAVDTERLTDCQTQAESSKTQRVDTEIGTNQAAMASASFATREKYPLKKVLGDVFQTLLFEVASLTLAVPLVKLGGIIDISEQDITPLVGTPTWFMGLVPNERGNLMVIDTQQFLMPEKPIVEKEYRYLIILDDSQWALACHSVGEARNLSPDDIRWSARSSSRPWFAGMVVESLSALLEVDELINLLAENIVE